LGFDPDVVAPMSEAISPQDRRDVADWLIQAANDRVKFFPQRQDGIDALMRAIAADLTTSRDTLAEAWEKGRKMGQSRAMRHMSDEPNLPLASELDNPYL
jgi:hypothetical protein